MKVRLLLIAPKTIKVHAMQSTLSATMFSAVSTAGYIVGAWHKHVLSFRFLVAFAVEGFVQPGNEAGLCTDGNDMSSLQATSAIFLTRTPFQLHDILIGTLKIEKF